MPKPLASGIRHRSVLFILCLAVLIVPLGMAVWAWAPRAIAESRDAQERSVDVPGQFWGGLALSSLVMGVIVHREVLPAAAVAVVAAALFVLAEFRAGDKAIIPLPLLRNRRLAGANVVAMAMTFGMYGVLFLLPLSWFRAGTLDPARAGVALLPMSVAFVVLSHRSGPWNRRAQEPPRPWSTPRAWWGPRLVWPCWAPSTRQQGPVRDSPGRCGWAPWWCRAVRCGPFSAWASQAAQARPCLQP